VVINREILRGEIISADRNTLIVGSMTAESNNRS